MGAAVLPSGYSTPWAPGINTVFEADIPRLDVFACLRIAASLTAGGARLATGLLARL